VHREKTSAYSIEIGLGLTSRMPLHRNGYWRSTIGHWTIDSVHDLIDRNVDADRCRIRTGFGLQNITRLRRYAVGLLKSFQAPYQSIAAMMCKLCFHTRLVFDYLRMTNNSASGACGP